MVSTYHHQNIKSIIYKRKTCIFLEIIRKYYILSKYLFLLELFSMEIKVLDVITQTLKILTSITKKTISQKHQGTVGEYRLQDVDPWK